MSHKTLGYSRPTRLISMESVDLARLLEAHLGFNSADIPTNGFGQRIAFNHVEQAWVDRNGKVQIVVSGGYDSADTQVHTEENRRHDD